MFVKKDSLKEYRINYIDYFKSNVVRIPLLQRNYVWKKEHLYDIKNDLEKYIENPELYKQNYDNYFLSIITCKNKDITIADGQQRIITLNFILSICKNIYENSGEYEKAKDIKLININYDNEKVNKYYHKTMDNSPIGIFKDVYNELFSFINENIDSIDDIVSFVNSVELTLRETSEEEDCYRLFEKENAGGEPVKTDVIVKNGLDYYSSPEQFDVTINKDIYKDIIDKLKSYARIKLHTKITLQKERAATIMNSHILKTKHSFVDFIDFCNIIQKNENTNLMYLIKKLNKKELRVVADAYAAKGNCPDADRDFQTLVFFPLLNIYSMSALLDKNPSEKLNILIQMVIDLIELYKTPQEINNKIIEKVMDDKLAFIHPISEIKRYFERTDKNKDNVFTVFELEALLLNNISCKIDLSSSQPTLEHRYPQCPDKEWHLHGYPINDYDQKKIIYNFGNMCVLNHALNSAAQNSWIEKKNIEYNKMDAAYKYNFNLYDISEYMTGNACAAYVEERCKSKIKYIQDNFPICNLILEGDF